MKSLLAHLGRFIATVHQAATGIKKGGPLSQIQKRDALL